MYAFRLCCLVLTILALSLYQAVAGDWPMWRHDAARSSASPDELPQQLHRQWSRKLPQARPAWPASQTKLQFDVSYEPIVVGHKLIVGSNVNDTVTAYDTRSGELVWTFYTNGPVRFAPAAANGRIYATSDDGFLYCLGADTGQQIWKFNGGPAVRPIIGNDRLVSSWPARGGVVVADGVAYFAASIWPSMGIFIHAVDAATGRRIWTNSETGAMFITHPHGADSFGSISPQGSLAVMGDHLIVPGGRTQPAVFNRTTGKLEHFDFGGKGGAGFDVLATKTGYVVGNSFYSLANGSEIMAVAGQVAADGWLIGSPGNGRPVISQTVDGEVEIKSTLDRRGRKVTKRTFQPREMHKFTPDGPWRVFAKAGQRLYAAGEDGTFGAYDYRPDLDDKQQPAWTKQVEGEIWSMLTADDRLFIVTRDAQIHCFGGEATEANIFEPEFKNLQGGSDASKTAETVLNLSKARHGYAIVLGLESPAFIDELVARTDLHIVAVDQNSQRVEAFRRNMDNAGVYGTRVAAQQGDPADFPFPPYMANLIVVENAPEGTAALQALFKPLRPYGGTACLHLSDDEHSQFVKDVKAAGLQKTEVTRRGEWTLLKRVGALPEAGVWTHQYGDASNSVVSADKRVKAPLGVLWFGGPSNDKVLPRHGHGPTPQVVGGRLFIEGPDMIRCVDVYTGRVWWERDLPGVGKFYDNTSHQPGAGEIGSNYVSLEDFVYVVYGRDLLKLESTTGKTIGKFTLQPGPDGSSPHWGFLAAHKDLLIATSSPVQVDGPQAASIPPSASLKGYQPLIKQNAEWQYLAGSDPTSEWTTIDFKPSKPWKRGAAGFGYGDGDDRTELKAMAGKFTRVYVRHEFEGKQTIDAEKLALTVNFDDAFIAYLNGKEIVRVGVGQGNGAKAAKIESHEAKGFETFDITRFRTLLKPGRNVIALEGHNVGSTSSDFSLDPYLLVKPGTTTTPPETTEPPKPPAPKLAGLLKPSQYSSASRRLVVLDRHTGEVLWSRDAEFNFRHNCICVADGKLFCIDGVSPKKLDTLRRRGLNADGKAKLYALNANTGEELWSTSEDVFGTFLNYSVKHDVLVQAGSAYRDRARDEVGTGIVAYRGSDGEVLWKDRDLQHGGPCLLWKDTIITNGGGGFQLELLTGKPTGWKYSRMYGCNTANGSEHLLTFRSGAAGFYDLAGDSGTGNLGGFKSSCTSSLVVADGVLNAPDYTRTCSCAYQNQTSLAMIHMPEAELWTYGSVEIDAEQIDRIGINFGAPGDRRDDNGTLWLDYPDVGGPSPKISLEVKANDPRWFRQHASFIGGNGPNWVAASGGIGIETIALTLQKTDKPTRYTIRLHFSEPDDLKPGERVFDVQLQGNTVLENFDVVKAADGRNRAIVKEFTGIEVRDTIHVTLKPIKGKPPVLSGIEVIGAAE